MLPSCNNLNWSIDSGFNITTPPDAKTLRKLLADMNALGYQKIKVVLDRGFFSAANINGLYQNHVKFLMAAKLSLKLVQTHYPANESANFVANSRTLTGWVLLGGNSI